MNTQLFLLTCLSCFQEIPAISDNKHILTKPYDIKAIHPQNLIIKAFSLLCTHTHTHTSYSKPSPLKYCYITIPLFEKLFGVISLTFKSLENIPFFLMYVCCTVHICSTHFSGSNLMNVYSTILHGFHLRLCFDYNKYY